MKERGQNLQEQSEKDDALMNFVSYQAQEAILDPNVSDEYKDKLLESAIETIHQVAERKAVYFTKHGDGRKTRAGVPHIKSLEQNITT
jgi:hypothetical protein